MRLKSSILIAITAITLLVCPISSAYADETENPKGFIDAIAQQTGLSSSDVVSTAVGILAAGSGINLANNVAVNFGLDLNDNLSNLVDAADYPAWETLSSDSKAAYGNDKSQYDAAKFNSLMEAFGLGDARNRYYGFDSSGGGNWQADWTENELDKLDVFGRIGTNWALGLSNTAGDVSSAITDRNAITSYFPAQYYSYTKTDDDTLWPSKVSSSVNYVMTQQIVATDGNTNMYGNSTSPVYAIYLSTGDTIWFYDSVFSAWYSRNASFNPAGYPYTSFTMDGVTSYFVRYTQSWSTISIPVNNSSTLYTDDVKKLVHCLLTGDSTTNGGVQDVIDYPVDLPDDTSTYYPEQGVTKSTPWANFILEREPVIPATGDLAEVIALLRRFLFYTTGQLKVHDEGIYDQITDLTTGLNSSLAGIQATLDSILAKTGLDAGADTIIGDFDYPELQVKSNDLVEDISTLAPFGSMLVISETIGILSQTEQITEPKLDVPFKFGLNQDYSVEIDLSWLDPLKPLINALLIMVLVMTLAGVTLRFVELEASA